MDLMHDRMTSNADSDVKPCGCRGIRICMECAEESSVIHDKQAAIPGGGFRCKYSFEEPPEEMLNCINFPSHKSCDSSDDDAPCSCKVLDAREPYPEIDGVKFPYFELLHPDILNGEISSTTDEETDESAQKVVKKGEKVEKYYAKKEKRETRTKRHSTDKYRAHKSRHKEHKRKIEKRKIRRHSSSWSSDSSESDWSKELNKYRKDQQLQKKSSRVPSGDVKLLNRFQSGKPLKTVTNEEVQSTQSALGNLKVDPQVEIIAKTSSAAQEDADVKMEVNVTKSERRITVPEDKVATCELPPLFNKKREDPVLKKPSTSAIEIIQNYSSHSEEEESSHQSPCHRNESKRSRCRSPDRERDNSRAYKRPRRRSRSMEENQTSYPDEGFSNFDGYDDEEEIFYCKPCLKTMNSLKTWESHISGKKHLKAVKLSNPEQMATESVPQLNADFSRRSKFKAPPPGYKRVKRAQQSEIKKALIKVLKQGGILVGLNEVMELISSNKEYSYYCNLCDAICMANSIIGHLVSFRHKLNYLKTCNLKLYNKVCYQKRDMAEPQVNGYFMDVNTSPGEVNVFEDVPITHYNDLDLPGPSTSTEYPRYVSDTASVISDYSIADTFDSKTVQIEPETSKGDFYCRVCNSHMNSANMWVSHVTGKRHEKNLKKAPGEAPSKVKYIKSDSRARLYRVIREWESQEEPRNAIICGLDYICERRLENGHELYNCYLCHSNCTPIEIIDHLISLKHMRKYIEKEDPEQACGLAELTRNMSNPNISCLHLEICMALVEKKGQGKIEVLVPR